ncbi:GYDIA family GHMP kinase [Winogradskyella tangerina]|uniref:GYDIA family GHMP kinase n=1 Tax=Winogradskyella tangerina TaxID=2023240 RepID=UPI000DBE3DA2|nr:GYDIA family GHMP kinase [Winogradskyella tangerina]
MESFKSNGKLLLTGEYVVLDGALALAIPTKYSQRLNVEKNDSESIIWKSYDEQGTLWFEGTFNIDDSGELKAPRNEDEVATRLQQILKAAQLLNPKFLNTHTGYTINTKLDFNRKWGLGTSSTLINNIARWANVDAYELLDKTFGGSGYDIACAQYDTPITYQLLSLKDRKVAPIKFNPSFKSNLYFVYLNQKQNSRDGIKAYKSLANIDNQTIESINEITKAIIAATTLSEFEALIKTHERIISKLIQQPTIQSKWFNDFEGTIKSLGAWGGDFILVASASDPTEYFNSKGFETIIPYKEMVLN